MAVNSTLSRGAIAETDRQDQLLAAACRVITRSGTRRLSLRDVADEAGVSKTLIHYYFSSRDDLLAKAYEFADERGRERVRERLSEQGSAARRLAQLLQLYLGDELEINEDWILWTELSSAAVFEPDLRPVMQRSFASWTAWIESLIRDAILEGAMDARTQPEAVALRLIALVDGLGSLLVRGLIDHAHASAALRTMLDQEFGIDSTEAGHGADHVELSSTYLRLLAGLARDAVTGLDALASTKADNDALRAVERLIDQAAGRTPSTASTSRKRNVGDR